MDLNLNFNQLSQYEKALLYINSVIPILNKKALFSDGTKDYRYPSEPMANDRVTIRFRTAKENVDFVTLCSREKNPGKDPALSPLKRFSMEKIKSDRLFDYYEKKIQLSEKAFEYYFEIQSGQNKCYYNKKGVAYENSDIYNFCIVPGFKTPDWAKGAVIYQIFVDRFCNGDKSNDVLDGEYFYIGEKTVRAKSWNKYPDAMDVRSFYGGDLAGVKSKLDYLQDLGVEVIYFNPLFVSPSNHKYDIQDYDYIDPHFGVILNDTGDVLKETDTDNKNASKYRSRVTNKENLIASNQLFIDLVKEIHNRGMRVILDGVFNHCGSFNKWLDREKIYENEVDYEKGAYVDRDSPYCSFFRFRGDKWPYNDQYDGWWGHDTLPKLNYENSPKLREYVMEIGKKWVSPPYNVDGWRLDVAADLGQTNEYNHDFWKEFRKNVKSANPEALILAEHYGDPFDWLQGDEWDTIMNYDAFMEPISWFLTGMEKHSDEYRGDMIGQYEYFYGSMSHFMSRFHTQSMQTAMNELSNHDHSRFLTRTNHQVGRIGSVGAELANKGVRKEIFRLAVLMQMTWPGAPTVYYGDEAGVCGWTDPDNRRTYPWGAEDHELIQYHRELIRIHKDYEALRLGSLKFLDGGQQYLVYGRFTAKEKIIIMVNNGDVELSLQVNAWELGLVEDCQFARLLQTKEKSFNLASKFYECKNGVIFVKLPKYSGMILKKPDNHYESNFF